MPILSLEESYVLHSSLSRAMTWTIRDETVLSAAVRSRSYLLLTLSLTFM